MYIIVGVNGTILTSTDGITWTSRTSGTSNYLWDITYGQISSTYYSKGSISYGIVSSTSSTTYPSNNTPDNTYWYISTDNTIGYNQGVYIEDSISNISTKYPDNGYQDDIGM